MYVAYVDRPKWYVIQTRSGMPGRRGLKGSNWRGEEQRHRIIVVKIGMMYIMYGSYILRKHSVILHQIINWSSSPEFSLTTLPMSEIKS